MADPVAFAQARLDEDQAGAEACPETEWQAGAPLPIRQSEPDGWFLDGRVNERNSKILARGVRMHDPDGHCIAHAAKHDPARTLRDVAAKRAILAIHRHAPQAYPVPDETVGCEVCHIGAHGEEYNGGWCDTVRALVAVWSDHPDYDPAWAPEDTR